MSYFATTPTPIRGLLEIERLPRADARGFFSRVFCSETFAAFGWQAPLCQLNQSLTRTKGTVRGLHFQHPPHAEDKFVCCLAGEVFDVAVDLRRGSPTFLAWYGVHLSGPSGRCLLIPKGFAHGFQTLSDDCMMLYCHSHPYDAASEGALSVREPRLAIAWPLPIADLSERDAQHPLLTADYAGLDL